MLICLHKNATATRRAIQRGTGRPVRVGRLTIGKWRKRGTTEAAAIRRTGCRPRSIPGRKKGVTDNFLFMFSYEDRLRTVQLYIKLGKRIGLT